MFRGNRRPLHASARQPSLILIGPDNLRALEDLLGEEIVEEVMEAIERRISRALGGAGTLRRIGQRYLAVTLAGPDRTAASALVARLQISVAQDLIATSHGAVAVTVSAGCALGEYADPKAQLAAARRAHGEALASGIGCIRFAPEGGAGLAERERSVAAARLAMGALRERDFMIAFQPVVQASGTNRAAFHECLVRVRGTDGDPVAAGKFLPEMERLGLAPMIDRQVLVLALETLRRHPGTRLSINISPQTMQDAQWRILFDEGTRHDPSLAERLIVEITETASMLDPERTLGFMNPLRHKGVAFALDDFGIGNTSLASLREFRFDILKIDGSFIANVATNPDHRFLISKLVEIGQHFEMMTVAEFVETAVQARILRDLGVEFFQGYYFGSPGLVLTPQSMPDPVVVNGF